MTVLLEGEVEYLESIIVWAAIIAICLVVEGMTAALVAIWFVPGAAVSLLLQLVGVKSFAVQIIVFFAVSIAFAVLLRGKIKESFSKPQAKTNLDTLIGKKAVVEEEIPEDSVGRVRISGMSWAAYSNEKRTIEVGEKVTVLEISGVKLRCAPVSELVGSDIK